MKKILLLTFCILFILSTITYANESNLINETKNGKELRISYLRGYKLKTPILNIYEPKFDDGIYLYNANYFKYKLVHSDFDASVVNIEKNIVKNSFNFLKSGGAECITATYNGKSTSALVKNQADWFLIDAHGFDSSPAVQTADFLGFQPINFFKEFEGHEEDVCNDLWLTRYKEPSYLEGIQVLILDFCFGLKPPRYVKHWYKVLPNGLILGYSNEVLPWMTNYVIKKLSEELDNLGNKNLTPKELGDLWLNLHDNASNDYWLGYSAIFAGYIYEKKFCFIKYVRPSIFGKYEAIKKSSPIVL